jgi:hypothetical protein
MTIQFKRVLLIALLTIINCTATVSMFLINKNQQKFDYQIELINQNDVKIMNENNKTLYITTFDSLSYYIEKDNL